MGSVCFLETCLLQQHTRDTGKPLHKAFKDLFHLSGVKASRLHLSLNVFITISNLYNTQN